jgi:16S rRNA (uracil1498-N3)-methyltransferase
MAGFRSFIFPDAVVSEKSVTLEARESHHLVRVFRARPGDDVELLDGAGKRYLGKIEKADARAAVVALDTVEEVPLPSVKMTLLQSMPKGKAMDLILRMATEIGVSVIQPVYTDQSEIHLNGERMQAKVEKWRGGMVEACKQCGLVRLPKLYPPLSLNTWLEANTDSDALKIVASLEAGSRPLMQTLRQAELPQEIIVAVGPEGDFTPAEYEAMRGAGFQPVRLGTNILRAETASAYMLSVIDQVFSGAD